MNRRSFLVVGILGLIKSANEAIAVNKPNSDDSYQLSSSEVLEVKSNQSLILPSKPKHGDWVMLLIGANSLHNPGNLRSYGAKVLNFKSSVKLDSLANVVLRYNSDTNNWQLS